MSLLDLLKKLEVIILLGSLSNANKVKYYVYDNTGNKVSSEGYSYVELYTKYYAVVNSNKEVHIYAYDRTKLNIQTVTVGNHKYYGTENPAFKVKTDGKDYIVSVWDGSKYVDTVVNEKVEETPELPSTDGEENQGDFDIPEEKEETEMQ